MNKNPKTLASAITYLPFGGITGLTYGNGLTLTQGYDNQYRISSIVTGSILDLTYGYDANGNITSILDGVNPSGGEVLEFPGAYSYQTGTNKLTHIEATPPIDFGYDANANITSETGWTYIYDLSNQLIRVLQDSNQVAEYTYNGAGQRIKKVTQTETRIFHYDLRGHLIAETNLTGQMLAEYIYLGDQLLSMIKPGESIYYFHNDHLGTPQVLTDDSQTIAWKAVYTPFGEAVPSIQTIDNPFRFPGQYYDPETALHYNYFRYYNPQTGRYITPDPIGLEGGINLFVYTGNPIIDVDPFGLLKCSCAEFISEAEGIKIAQQAKTWEGTPYKSPGHAKGVGADCTGSTWQIYNNTGNNYVSEKDLMTASDFGERSTNCKMQVVPTPQAGDVVKFSSHLAIYDPTIGTTSPLKGKRVKDVLWTTHGRPSDKVPGKYGTGPIEYFDGSPTYYRFCKKPCKE
jgi:RHS repeat-associated protein